MNEKFEPLAAFQIIMTLIFALIIAVIFIDIEKLKQDKTELKNDLNYAQAKIRIMESVDDKIYKHLERLGNNDLMIQSWIEEIQCMLWDCRNEWREENAYD